MTSRSQMVVGKYSKGTK